MSAYGRGGRFGVGTPQANPTVEAELAILLPRDCTLLATRLTSSAPSLADRLVAYIETLDAALGAYDELRPDAFGFACTGSSYLVGAAREAQLVKAASAAWGRPVVTACSAIAWALERLGARRIALVAPYPAELLAAGVAWWRAAGFQLTSVERVETGRADTRGIYALGADAADGAIVRARVEAPDVVLLSGTGMPSLAAIARAGQGPPVISSNLALAARLLDLASADRIPAGEVAPPGWRNRLAEALSPLRPA